VCDVSCAVRTSHFLNFPKPFVILYWTFLLGCRIIESGWDKGNWFIMAEKVFDPRLDECAISNSCLIPDANKVKRVPLNN
jgi:hypothetical protein